MPSGCANFWSNYAAKPASTGRAQKPLVELAILGAGDRHLPTGEVGEIAHPQRREHQLLLGQSRGDATHCSRPTAIVRTGDVGYLDEDGYLFIVDRKKEIIIRGGENISAAEVEAECYACPTFAEVAVFGAPTSGWAKCRSPSSTSKNGDCRRRQPSRLPRRRAREVQNPGALHLLA